MLHCLLLFLVVLLAISCVSMLRVLGILSYYSSRPPVLQCLLPCFSSTSSHHLCCDALCYISVFLATTCVAYLSSWILALCARCALPHPLLMLALQCAIPLLSHAFMDRLRTCVSPMPLLLMYQLWYTPHISHLTLYTYISHFTFYTSHLRISACQEEFLDLRVARKRLQSARK